MGKVMKPGSLERTIAAHSQAFVLRTMSSLTSGLTVFQSLVTCVNPSNKTKNVLDSIMLHQNTVLYCFWRKGQKNKSDQFHAEKITLTNRVVITMKKLLCMW